LDIGAESRIKGLIACDNSYLECDNGIDPQSLAGRSVVYCVGFYEIRSGQHRSSSRLFDDAPARALPTDGGYA